MVTLETLEKTFKDLQKDHKVPGAIVALGEKGNKVYEKALGFSRLNDKRIVTNETVFGLASVTKSFTCAAIMHLQERGLLKISDRVREYLPEFRMMDDQRIDDITIHHFMTHSSGFPPLFALQFAMKRPTIKNPQVYEHIGEDKEQSILHTYEDLMDYIAEQNLKLFAEPGRQFSYSNEAYSLLGAIIERVSGQSFESYLYENIIDPIGMKHTRFTMRELSWHEDQTDSFGKEEKNGSFEVVTDQTWTTSTCMQATGFLKSTAKDMLKYADMFLNKGRVRGQQVLSGKSVSEMLRPQMKVIRNQYYGYGFRIIPNYYGYTFIGHGGSLRSVSSRFGMIPERQLSGVVLANLIGFPAARVLDLSFKEYLGVDVNQSVYDFEEISISKDRLERYLGQYRSDEGADLTFKLVDGKLVIQGKYDEFKTKFISETELIYYTDHNEDILEVLLNEKSEPYAVVYGSRVVHKVK